MSIQVNTGATAVNWESLLSKIGDVQKTSGADGKESFTVTMKVGDETKTYSFGIPDDLEAPNSVDQNAINSLCDKLLADKDTFNLSDEDFKALKEALTNALTQTGAGKVSDAKKTLMFDIYQMMALLVEVAQKERDAAREQRQAENVSIQTSILSQASMQRRAALVSMIASVACCAIQVGISLRIMGKQTSAFKTQMQTLETTGVKGAQNTLTQHTNELKSYQADVMYGKNAQGVPLTPEAREAKITELKANVVADKVNVERAQNMRAADETYLQATRDFAKFETYNNMIFALGNVAQSMVQSANSFIQANATEISAVAERQREELDQTRDLFNQAQELVNQVVKLMQAVISAETQSMRDAIQV